MQRSHDISGARKISRSCGWGVTLVANWLGHLHCAKDANRKGEKKKPGQISLHYSKSPGFSGRARWTLPQFRDALIARSSCTAKVLDRRSFYPGMAVFRDDGKYINDAWKYDTILALQEESQPDRFSYFVKIITIFITPRWTIFFSHFHRIQETIAAPRICQFKHTFYVDLISFGLFHISFSYNNIDICFFSSSTALIIFGFCRAIPVNHRVNQPATS